MKGFSSKPLVSFVSSYRPHFVASLTLASISARARATATGHEDGVASRVMGCPRLMRASRVFRKERTFWNSSIHKLAYISASLSLPCGQPYLDECRVDAGNNTERSWGQ